MDRPEAPSPNFILKYLESGDMRFQDFMELALYHPEHGYYTRRLSPIGPGGDYVTNPSISTVFGFALSRLVSEFLGGRNDDSSLIVDIGCGDGELIHDVAKFQSPALRGRASFYGVDRSLSRVDDERRDGSVTYVSDLALVPPSGRRLLLANELFDAIPFSRLVMRGDELHELWIGLRPDGQLDWVEREAPAPVSDYFAANEIELLDGQFADVSLEWGALYGDLARSVDEGLIVTFDYGFEALQLFDRRIRRFGTAAAYRAHQVSRDLLASPGQQDLTAHINFSDLIRAGEEAGLETLFFDRQAKFLLALGITEHELFKPVSETSTASAEEAVRLLDARESARRLVLPDGIGEDIRVLVQSRGVPATGWSFQRKLF